MNISVNSLKYVSSDDYKKLRFSKSSADVDVYDYDNNLLFSGETWNFYKLKLYLDNKYKTWCYIVVTVPLEPEFSYSIHDVYQLNRFEQLDNGNIFFKNIPAKLKLYYR